MLQRRERYAPSDVPGRSTHARRWRGRASGGPGPSAPGRAGQLAKATHVLQFPKHNQDGKGSVVIRLGLDELAELTPSEATTHLTLWCTGQAVVLMIMATGLANAVFVAAVVTDRVNERSYAHRYRPEYGDDEEDLCLILANDATRTARDHHGWHTGDEDADRNTG